MPRVTSKRSQRLSETVRATTGRPIIRRSHWPDIIILDIIILESSRTMALSQDAFIGIFAAILAADIIVIVAALVWSRVQRRERSLPPSRASSVAAGSRPNGSAAVNGGRT